MSITVWLWCIASASVANLPGSSSSKVRVCEVHHWGSTSQSLLRYLNISFWSQVLLLIGAYCSSWRDVKLPPPNRSLHPKWRIIIASLIAEPTDTWTPEFLLAHLVPILLIKATWTLRQAAAEMWVSSMENACISWLKTAIWYDDDTRIHVKNMGLDPESANLSFEGQTYLAVCCFSSTQLSKNLCGQKVGSWKN